MEKYVVITVRQFEAEDEADALRQAEETSAEDFAGKWFTYADRQRSIAHPLQVSEGFVAQEQE